MTRFLSWLALSLLVSAAAFTAACSEAGTATSSEDVATESGRPVSVSILSPRPGEVFSQSNVNVIVSSSNIEVGKDGIQYGIVLDKPVEEGKALPKGDGVIHTTDTRATLTDVPSGEHTITVVLLDGDKPIQPLTSSSVSIRVK